MFLNIVKVADDDRKVWCRAKQDIEEYEVRVFQEETKAMARDCN